MFRRNDLIVFALSFGLFFNACQNHEQLPEDAEFIKLDKTSLALTIAADSLDVPWDLQYDKKSGSIIFSEIAGKIKKLDLQTRQIETLLHIPDVYHKRTLGLLGMALYQPKNEPTYLFVSYTSMLGDSIYSNLVRYEYNDKPINPKTLLRIPGSTGHNGSRIIISNDQKVLWATGDAASNTFAQDSTAMNGKILRLNIDGSIPDDNPIPHSYVYAWGFRNMQGLTQSPSGKVYTSEHGDAIEDEVNWIRPMHNYGWPQIEGMHDTDAEIKIASHSSRTEPIRSWTPVIAPAGLAYYGSKTIPEWTNTLLLTTLKDQSLRILKLSEDGTQITDEHILFSKYLGRLRSVLVVPNGDVYFSTSNRDWNPQPGFPRSKDDIIYRLHPTTTLSKTSILPTKPETKIAKSGKELYKAYCESCHKENGKGLPPSFPPLFRSAMVNGSEQTLIKTILNGLSGKEINGNKYEGAMPSFSFLKNEEIASIATYIRTHFSNQAASVNANSVQSNR